MNASRSSASRFAGLTLASTIVVVAAGCAIVPTPDGGVIVPAPVVVGPPTVVVNPWWGYRSYDYGPRYYGGPRYYSSPRYYDGPRYQGRPVPPPPRYHGPAGGPSFPPPLR